MISCDKCGKWQHAYCMGITQAKFAEFEKRKDLLYHCEKCEPREIDSDAAKAFQRDLLMNNREETKTSTDTASTDDDDGAIRRPSRDDRKAMQIGRLFEKIHQQETNRKGKRGKEKIEKSDNEQDGNNLESDDEPDDKKRKPGPGRRGRPKGSGVTKRSRIEKDEDGSDRLKRTRKTKDMTRQTESPVQSDGNQTPGQVGRASRYGTRPKRGRKPGRRPGPINPEPVETNEPPGSDTEDSADSGLVEEEQTVNLTVPLRNPYVRRKLDIKQFENVKSFGQDVTVTFHDWEWRGGNNSKLIKKESDTWTSSLNKSGSGHFKKQWLMKNTEETKEVPDVDEIVREELRKRNVDLTKIPGLGKIQEEGVLSNLPIVNDPSSITLIQEDNSDHSSQTSSTSQEKQIWQPFPTSPTSQQVPPPNIQSDNEGTPKMNAEKTTKKLSFAEYRKRNEEKKRKEKEEKAKREAEIKKQEESRLSGDQLSAVLTSAIGAASNGSRVCDINSNDIAWLSQLVGMNLDTNQTGSQLPVETTAERLSRLYHTSEQVLNTMRAAKVLAALTAQQNK